MIGKSGGGIHHLGFMVSGYDKMIEEMRANGVEVFQSSVITTKRSAVTHGRLIMDVDRLTDDVERVEI